MERFSELMKNLSDMPKSETFVYITKITAATLSINKIIPVSIPLILLSAYLKSRLLKYILKYVSVSIFSPILSNTKSFRSF